MRILFILVALWVLAVMPAAAQNSIDDVVYITTQDIMRLRAGPGQNWDTLAIIPHSTTLRAIGRTITGEWIQVMYEGELSPNARPEFTRDGVTYGWLWYGLLIWSGDMLTLPIDGVASVTTAREAGPVIYLSPDDPIYRGYINASTQTSSPFPYVVQVEVTGRVGQFSNRGFWIQFKMQGQYYWVSSWTVGIPRGYSSVPDNSTRYAYGRLLRTVRLELDTARATYSTISSRWNALATGQPTTCNDIPDDVKPERITFTESDLQAEPLYRPISQALNEARAGINSALARFRVVCGPLESRTPVSGEDIRLAQTDLADAAEALTLVSVLIMPFQRRDPTFGE
jgi:hypothetical protein